VVGDERRWAVRFVTIADLDRRPTEAVLGFEQHGFGVPVLRVRCCPEVAEPAYFDPCTVDADLALVVVPDGWLTEGALVEAARIYLRRSGDWGPTRGRGEDVTIGFWTPLAVKGDGTVAGDGVVVFVHEGGIACEVGG
jgi:hypothetical protein